MLTKRTRREEGCWEILTLTEEGGMGVWQMLILTDKGRRGGLDPTPYLADIVCEQPLTPQAPTPQEKYVFTLNTKFSQ